MNRSPDRRDAHVDFAALVHDLSLPEAYPWPVASVEVVETHISWVFLAGDRVVKLKRPVDLGFIDLTHAADRRRACLDEDRLNRRLTDGVYLGVVPILLVDGRFRVGEASDSDGQPGGDIAEGVELATFMRRLPAERMLDAIVASGHVPRNVAGRLAERLLPFHSSVPTCAPLEDAEASAVMAAAVTTENLDQLEPFSGDPLGSTELRLVSAAVRGFVSAGKPLLVRRAASGWIREGHGDLRAEHVCLEADRVQIYDCVEFSRDIRCADVASDLAFLLMDLERLGQGEIAADLVDRYREAGFDLPDTLLRYYRVHRALVRAKVACLERLNTQDDAARRCAAEADDYLHMAAAQALRIQPVLYLMTGLSGTGKSTMARSISRACNVPIVASDDVRKELAGRSGPAPADWGQGIYASEWTGRTYARLRQIARERLQAGQGVIVDATFLDTEQRERCAGVAAAADVPAMLVETVCDPDTALARIRARAARGGGSSDATEAIYARQRQQLDERPPGIPDGAVAVKIDTNDGQVQPLEPLFASLAEQGAIASALLPTSLGR